LSENEQQPTYVLARIQSIQRSSRANGELYMVLLLVEIQIDHWISTDEGACVHTLISIIN